MLSIDNYFYLFVSWVALSVVLLTSCTGPEGKPPPQPQSALEVVTLAVSQTPSYENYISLGLEYGKMQKHAQALEAYQKASAINPLAPVAWNNICFELTNMDRFAEAITACEKALAGEKNFVLARNNLKAARAKLADLKKVLNEQKKALISQQGLTAQDWINLGMRFYDAREFTTAIEIWEKIKPSEPLYATARNNIASSYILLKKFANADTALREAEKREPGNQLFTNNRKWLRDEKASEELTSTKH